MYFLMFLGVWLVLPVLGYWPIVFKTENDWSNGWLRINIVDPTKVSSFTLVNGYAEEVCEWYLKAFVFGVMVIPIAVLVARWDVLLNVGVFLLYGILYILSKVPVLERLNEYVGKAANIAVNPRDSSGAATRLVKYYSCFKGMSVYEAQVGIDRAMPIGKFLVWLLKRNITRNTK